MRAELTLEPVPSAARQARRWVKRELADGRHGEFTDAAVLGVSELVTNAVLHVRSPIVVRLSDEDDERLRIEVYDDSPRPPTGHPAFVPDGRHAPSTIGRGLQIVDSISHSWGVSYESVGKCIWFMPAPHARETHGSSEAFDWDAVEEEIDRDVDRVPVMLVDLPVMLFAHYRERFFDLQREMTLIALDATHGSQLAQRLIDAAQRVQDFHLEATGVTAQAEAAIDAGRDRADIRVDVPRDLAPVLLELRQLLGKANEYCRTERLLTLEAGPQEQALREWYLGELAAQAAGAAPTAWPGLFVVTDPSDVAIPESSDIAD